MSFGFRFAPTHFYHYMNQILSNFVDISTLFTRIIFLSSQVLNRNVVSIYEWYFYRLSKFKYHFRCNKCELFSRKVKLLAYTVSAASVGIV